MLLRDHVRAEQETPDTMDVIRSTVDELSDECVMKGIFKAVMMSFKPAQNVAPPASDVPEVAAASAEGLSEVAAGSDDHNMALESVPTSEPVFEEVPKPSQSVKQV